MSATRLKAKGRRSKRRFISVYRDILDSEQYAGLSSSAVKLLMDLWAQFNGRNNGDLDISVVRMFPRGWRSKVTLYRARDELLRDGWIVISRRGGNRVAHLYALTFESIDECNGKLDIRPTAAPLNSWKKLNSAVQKLYPTGTESEP